MTWREGRPALWSTHLMLKPSYICIQCILLFISLAIMTLFLPVFSQFLLPGLVDTHIHAPQYVNSGVGYDKMLMDWLDAYTFPAEAKFQKIEVAKDVYPKVVVSQQLSMIIGLF